MRLKKLAAAPLAGDTSLVGTDVVSNPSCHQIFLVTFLRNATIYEYNEDLIFA